jgi:hypothetical protein
MDFTPTIVVYSTRHGFTHFVRTQKETLKYGTVAIKNYHNKPCKYGGKIPFYFIKPSQREKSEETSNIYWKFYTKMGT